MHFVLGIFTLIIFLFLSRPLLIFIPSLVFKIIAVGVLGMACLIGFLWLVPEFTSSGSRQEIETDLGGLYESVEDIGKSVEFDLLHDYRHNSWLNTQREKHESGYYRDNNGVMYYNAEQDKEYYQIPSGQWQETGLWNTPINNPFEASGWQPVTTIDQITGSWAGTNIIEIPADAKPGFPAFSLQFYMYIKCNQNISDMGYNIDLENLLDEMLAAYPDTGYTKETLWQALFSDEDIKKTSALEFTQYGMALNAKEVLTEDIINAYTIQINNSGTEIKAVIPGNVFGILAMDSIECIISKQTP